MSLFKEISLAEFEDQCLALIGEVERTGEPLLVTRDGKPFVQVVPADWRRDLRGTVEQLVSDEELIKPLYPEWEPAWPE